MAEITKIKNEIAERLSMLFTNVEAWQVYLNNLYQSKINETLETKQYDKSAVIKEYEIPNFTKYLNDSVKSGTVNPNKIFNGETSELYINSEDKSIWVCTKSGDRYWVQLFTEYSLENHDSDEYAHKDFVARIEGNSNVNFDVKNIKEEGVYADLLPDRDNVAITKAYVGELDTLNTIIKTTLVDAINEINDLLDNINMLSSAKSTGNNNSMNSGNLLDGDADIIDAFISDQQTNVSVGTYYTYMEAEAEAIVELVGGGGSTAYTDGGVDEYGDTAWAWHYWHEGGGGAYFKGTIKAPVEGNLKVITPASGGAQNANKAGGDAIAYFIPAGGTTQIEVARAGGGASGRPPVSSGYGSAVAGGKVTYNKSYVIHVDKAINGTTGVIWKSQKL